LFVGIRLGHYHVTVKSATRIGVPPSVQPWRALPR